MKTYINEVYNVETGKWEGVSVSIPSPSELQVSIPCRESDYFVVITNKGKEFHVALFKGSDKVKGYDVSRKDAVINATEWIVDPWH